MEEPIKLVITIDTEEDEWGRFTSASCSSSNVTRIPELQNLFSQYRAVPTYLITYQVAKDKRSVSVLKNIAQSGMCEIGSHCHPWNTPPFEEETNEKNSMLCNLPSHLQSRKLKNLHEEILRSFEKEPISFRAGRWGYSTAIGKGLWSLGYKVDTSIMAYTDWSTYYGPDFSAISSKPFRIPLDGLSSGQGAGNKTLLEIPGTVGYLQENFSLCNDIFRFFARDYIRRLKIIGLLQRIALINKVALSPEVSDASNMISLAKRLMKQGCKVINMFFHSTSLKPGLSCFVTSEKERMAFLQRIREFLMYCSDAGIACVSLSQMGTELIEDVSANSECGSS